MRIRNFKNSDVPKLMETYEKFYHHDLSLGLSTGTATVENDAGIPVAFGLLVPALEAVTVVDKDASIAERLAAIEGLIEVAKKRAKRVGIKHVMVYVQDELFSNTLEKRFGFVRVLGNTLALEVI